MIQFFYGDGKGKSTALLGGAVRMAGSGGKVLYVQFFKNNDSSEVRMLENMENVTYLPQDVLYTMAFDSKDMEEQMKKINDGYNKKIEEVYELQNENSYDMIVLDEVVYAYENVFAKDKFIKFLEKNRDKTEIVISGHTYDGKLGGIADYISKVVKEKHPFDLGVDARRGIEY